MPDGTTFPRSAAPEAGTRLRKAWAIRADWQDEADPDSIYFAPTAAKAKGQCLSHLLDCGYSARDAFVSLRCRRAADRDIRLPPRHALADKLGPELLHLVTHAYGGTGLRSGHRDYFYTSADDWDLYRLVVEFGVFDGPCHVTKRDDHGRQWAYFYLTPLGKQVAASVQPEYTTHA